MKKPASKARLVRDSSGQVVIKLSIAAAKQMARLEAANSPDFAVLVKAAGMNPKADFLGADLSGMPLGKSDLRGFNLTNADLRGTNLKSAKLGPDVILTGAKLDRGDRAAAIKAGAIKAGARVTQRTKFTDDEFWQYIAEGDRQIISGSLPSALKAFETAFSIARKLTDRDPANTQWQRDLSVSYERIGDVRSAQGDLSGALKAFEDGLAIRRKLTDRDPANTQWQRDLSVSYERIGDVWEEQGQVAEALASYRKSLPIAERLVKLDGTNATWKQDLVITRRRIEQLEAKLKRR